MSEAESIEPPPALVLGCNTPHGINVLSDWIEERTGHAPDFTMPNYPSTILDDRTISIGNGYDYGYGFQGGGGEGYGYVDGNGHGDGENYGNGHGDGCGDGDAYPIIYGIGEGDGQGGGTELEEPDIGAAPWEDEPDNDDDAFADHGQWDTCWHCHGDGGFHDCGEDCCPCADPEPNVTCPECDGTGRI